MTRDDIHQHVTLVACGQHYSPTECDQITDQVLDAAPLATWHLDESLDYVSPAMSPGRFWSIAQAVAGDDQ